MRRLALVALTTLMVPTVACGSGGGTTAETKTAVFAFDRPTTDQEARRAVDIIRRRADGLGLKSASAQLVRQHIVLKAAGENGRSADSAITELSRMGRLLFRPVVAEATLSEPPPTTPLDADDPAATVVLAEKDGTGKVVKRYTLGPSEMDGGAIADASARADVQGRWVIDFTMTPPGAVQFDQLAERNYQHQVALDFDGLVKSAPSINAMQFNGRGEITGDLKEQEAKDLAVILRAGALPRLLLVGSVDEQPSTTLSAAPAPTSTTTTTAAAPPAPPRCPRADGSETRVTAFQAPPPRCINPAKSYTATMKTSEGTMTIALDTRKAPTTVNNFVVLARYHFYDGLTFHRVVRDFVIQGGDPSGDGTGGPGYTFADELPRPGEYKVGSLVMANKGPDTNGSQFFIITGHQGVQLPPNYSLFGQMTSGMDIAQKINALANPGDPSGKPNKPVVIDSITIAES